MTLLVSAFTILCVLAGVFFFLAGSLGLLRFPDALSRLHALTKADTLGLGLIVLGLLPQAGTIAIAVKLVAIWLVLLVSAALVGQIMAEMVEASPAAGPDRPQNGSEDVF